MKYYHSKTFRGFDFEALLTRVEKELNEEGFGILTEIDLSETLKKKLNVDFRKYRILGACNPTMAHRALLAEPKIGIMLPCNVILEEIDEDRIEVSAVNPIASMQAVNNTELEAIATSVNQKLKTVIDNL